MVVEQANNTACVEGWGAEGEAAGVEGWGARGKEEEWLGGSSSGSSSSDEDEGRMSGVSLTLSDNNDGGGGGGAAAAGEAGLDVRWASRLPLGQPCRAADHQVGQQGGRGGLQA